VDVNAREERQLDLVTLGSFQREGRGRTGSSRTKVRTRTWRPTGATRRCTSCREANMTRKNTASVLHGCCWSAAWMSMSKTNTSTTHYTRQLSGGGSRSRGYFSITAQTRTWGMIRVRHHCTKCRQASMNSQDHAASASPGYCWSAVRIANARNKNKMDPVTCRSFQRGGSRSRRRFSNTVH
jgi:hypothetical protein